MRLIAIILIVLGALALIYGGFSYTQDKTAVKLGSFELNVKETKTVPVPLWAVATLRDAPPPPGPPPP
jgi:hypothetical protein